MSNEFVYMSFGTAANGLIFIAKSRWAICKAAIIGVVADFLCLHPRRINFSCLGYLLECSLQDFANIDKIKRLIL